mmetsp:Transcript_43257/g.110069  ORF Transcript_43257/g.110069 Transcript_43257/m.110069 type:complete len:203 (-) Transcript_43257:195-803(-)
MDTSCSSRLKLKVVVNKSEVVATVCFPFSVLFPLRSNFLDLCGFVVDVVGARLFFALRLRSLATVAVEGEVVEVFVSSRLGTRFLLLMCRRSLPIVVVEVCLRTRFLLRFRDLPIVVVEVEVVFETSEVAVTSPVPFSNLRNLVALGDKDLVTASSFRRSSKLRSSRRSEAWIPMPRNCASSHTPVSKSACPMVVKFLSLEL